MYAQVLDEGAARLRRTVDELGSGVTLTSAVKDDKEAAYQRRIAELEAQVRNEPLFRLSYSIHPFVLGILNASVRSVHSLTLIVFEASAPPYI